MLATSRDQTPGPKDPPKPFTIVHGSWSGGATLGQRRCHNYMRASLSQFRLERERLTSKCDGASWTFQHLVDTMGFGENHLSKNVNRSGPFEGLLAESASLNSKLGVESYPVPMSPGLQVYEQLLPVLLSYQAFVLPAIYRNVLGQHLL